jgi:hypothetical protein
MRWFIMAMMLSAGLAAAQDMGNNEAINQLNEYFRLRLYNDSVSDWNERSRNAWNANQTYTAVCGNCNSKHNIGDPPKTLYDFPLLRQPKITNYDSVKATNNVFDDGCAISYVAEPSIYNSYSNETWAQKNHLTLTIAVGCTTKTVNESNKWGGLKPQEPGSANHQEFLLPVEEKTTITVNGNTCFDETILHGEGTYPLQIDEKRLLQINCSLGNQSTAHVEFNHTCTGYTILATTYLVMGWNKKCERNWYMEKVCIPNCNSANAQCKAGVGGKGCQTVDCNSVCANIANRICSENEREPAHCSTRINQDWGHPDKGSSDSWVQKPPNPQNDPCRCRYLWNTADSCNNHIVNLQTMEKHECKDSKTYIISQQSNNTCSGHYKVRNSIMEGSITISSNPYNIAGVLIGDSAIDTVIFSPKHDLYRLKNQSIGEADYKEYRIFENDYQINQTRNDSSYLGFTYYEIIYDRQDPILGKKYVIRTTTRNETHLTLPFTVYGVENLTEQEITLITLEDRIRGERELPCNSRLECGNNSLCLDGSCFPLKQLKNTISLACLKEINSSKIEVQSFSYASKGDEIKIEGKLKTFSNPLEGKTIGIECDSNNYITSSTTNALGEFEFGFNMKEEKIKCTLTYEGDAEYAPSEANILIIPTTQSGDYTPLCLGGILLAFLAVMFATAEGKRTFYDYWEQFWRFFK